MFAAARRRLRRERESRRDGHDWIQQHCRAHGVWSTAALLWAHVHHSEGWLPPTGYPGLRADVPGSTVSGEPEWVHPDAARRVAEAFAGGADVVLGDLEERRADGLHQRPILGTTWDSVAALGGLPDGWILARPGITVSPVELCSPSGLVIRHIPWVLGYRRPGRPLAEVAQLAPQVVGTPLVTAVIPTRDRADLLGPCLEGLFSRTDWTHVEAVVVDHGSREVATQDLLNAARERWGQRVRVVRDDGAFNFSRLCNRGVAEAKGDAVLLLNNDIEPRQTAWLTRMLGWLGHEGVGAVGARLLYPDGTIQHAGMHVGRSWTAHVHRGAPGDSPGYGGRIGRTAMWTAATGACLLMNKNIYSGVGGLDESLPITWGDVELCMRLRLQRGLSTVVAQDAILTHHESATRRPQSDEFVHSAARALAHVPSDWTDPYAHPRYTSAAEQLDSSILPDTPADAPSWR